MASVIRSLRAVLQPAVCHPQPAIAFQGLPAAASDAAPAGGSWGLEHAAEKIGELLAPLWLAVPKSKTTRSRKRMRAANKSATPNKLTAAVRGKMRQPRAALRGAH